MHFCGCGFCCENKTKNPLESQGVEEKGEQTRSQAGWVYKDLFFPRPLLFRKVLSQDFPQGTSAAEWEVFKGLPAAGSLKSPHQFLFTAVPRQRWT